MMRIMKMVKMMMKKSVTYYDYDDNIDEYDDDWWIWRNKPAEFQTQKWSQQSPGDPFSSPPSLGLKIHDDENYMTFCKHEIAVKKILKI